MNLEGLLTFLGLLVAAIAIMGPVQRRSLVLFVPKWLLPVATIVAVLLLMLRDMPLGIPPAFGWRLDLVEYWLTLGAFVVPVAAALVGWKLWDDARLSSRNLPELEQFLQTALREGEFDEVDRVLRKNKDRLGTIPTGAASLLFDGRVVRQLLASHSALHLELLAREAILKSLENKLQAVEVVVREMLEAAAAPLQAAVVHKYGGIEHLNYSEQERKLIGATFENPRWYHDTNAHYPLIITAINKIESGTLDDRYNRPDENYVAKQGVSKRATCPIYLAAKMEALAIEVAIKAGSGEDFYISDLFQILQKILDHSSFDPTSSTAPAGMRAPYTPYSYLVEGTVRDLQDLTETAVQESVKRHNGPPEDAKPNRSDRIVVSMWSFCLWELMNELNRIDPVIVEELVESYFWFMFALGWQPSEVIFLHGQGCQSLNSWRDIFLKELQARLKSPKRGHIDMIKQVLQNLDFGKPFISEGYDWLETVLPAQFLPN